MDRGVGAAVRPLPESDRKDLAIQALAGSETVSDLAARHGVSRKFVYQQTHKARAALDDAFSPATPDEAVLFELAVTKTWLRQGPCCIDQWKGRTHPYPVRGHAMRTELRASKLQHAVQRMDGNLHLGCPTLVRVAAQSVTDDLLEPAHGGLDPGANVVSGGLLPGRSSVLGDALQMTIPLRRRGHGRVAWHGRGTRRHDDRRFRVTLGDCGGNAFLVVGAVRGERDHRCRHLVEQGTNLGAVIGILVGQHGCDDLPGVGVHAEVQLPPRPALADAMLLDQPLTRAT